MKTTILALLAAFALIPAAGQAQDRVNCGQYLAMTPEAKLAAIEAVRVTLVAAGTDYKIDPKATDADKVAFVDTQCTTDAWAESTLFDALGK